MADFPTLSRGVSLSNFKEELAYNPAIQSQAEDGTIISRGRFTGRKKEWEIEYTLLTEADKGLLDTLQAERNVSGNTFTWDHPKTDVEYSVRLKDPIEFRIEPSNHEKWSARFIIIEA